MKQKWTCLQSYENYINWYSCLMVDWGHILVYPALLITTSPEESSQTNNIQEPSDSEHVEDGPHHRHQQYRAELIKEESVGHEVSSLSYDRRQQKQEEDVRSEGGGSLVFWSNVEEEDTDDDTEDDEDTWLGEELVDISSFVKSWNNKTWHEHWRLTKNILIKPILMRAVTMIQRPMA